MSASQAGRRRFESGRPLLFGHGRRRSVDVFFGGAHAQVPQRTFPLDGLRRQLHSRSCDDHHFRPGGAHQVGSERSCCGLGCGAGEHLHSRRPLSLGPGVCLGRCIRLHQADTNKRGDGVNPRNLLRLRARAGLRLFKRLALAHAPDLRELQPPSDGKSEIATENTDHTDPNPTPKTFFPFTPHLFGGRGGTQLSGWGCGGPCLPCFPWLNPGWGRAALWRSEAAPD